MRYDTIMYDIDTVLWGTCFCNMYQNSNNWDVYAWS